MPNRTGLPWGAAVRRRNQWLYLGLWRRRQFFDRDRLLYLATRSFLPVLLRERLLEPRQFRTNRAWGWGSGVTDRWTNGCREQFFTFSGADCCLTMELTAAAVARR